MLEEYLASNPDVKREYFEDGKHYEIYNVVGNKPVYIYSHNLKAAIATKTKAVKPGGNLSLDLEGENCDCNIKSALFINKDKHQEIKTKINHLVPNCKSYQKIKSVVDAEGKGVYQGKIYVKDIAQKTNAYQLSKALLLSENSEFNSKPELEIYADDVKCSHGSTSGSVDENSIHYLMTRGLSKKQAVQLLVNGFLNEIIGDIKSNSVRKFIENKIEIQIHGY